MRPIPWNKAFRKRDGSLVNMEDIGGGGGSALPEYSEADAGKVLGVDEEGLLEWGELPASGAKLYYKTWERSLSGDSELAKFSDGAASSSGIHIAKFDASYGGNNISINGYTPISAIAIDSATGYAYMVGLQQMGDSGQYGYQVTYAIGSRAITSSGCKVRVFYVKNEDLNVLT